MFHRTILVGLFTVVPSFSVCISTFTVSVVYVSSLPITIPSFTIVMASLFSPIATICKGIN
jgi:hypothetical protein